MRLRSLCLVTSVAYLSGSNSFAAKPAILVLPKAVDAPMPANSLLLETERHLLLRQSGARSADFANTFYINIRGSNLDRHFLENYGEVNQFAADDFAVIQVAPGALQDSLSAQLHGHGGGCGNLFRLFGDTVETAAPIANPKPILALDEPAAEVAEAVKLVSTAKIRSLIEELAAINTRHHSSETGQGVAALLANKYRSLSTERSDVSIGTFDHGSQTSQNSLVLSIPGKSLPDEIVILGSHIDSIANWGGRAPGADDNASGTATNLEVYRVLMESGWDFARTIEIHGYAAEEVGLVGSQDMARKYKQAGKKVVAMLQIDMNLYRDGNEDRIWFVSNSTNAALNTGLMQLVDTYVHVPWSTATLSGGSSDHAAWTRQGYPAAFPFENPNRYNRNIHTANDTIANSGAFTQAAAFAKLGVAYLAHYAGAKL